MNFLQQALTGFEPQSALDAALTFSLAVLLADGGAADLLRLLSDPHCGGVEGVPGWIIERRDAGSDAGHESWPEHARFRAHVDPASYSLAHPEFFCGERTFLQHVRSLLTLYLRHHQDTREVRDLMEILSLRLG